MSKKSTSVLEQMVSFKTICLALEVPDRTLRRHMAAGRFPKPDIRIGNRFRWKQSTVEKFLAEAAMRV